LALRPREVAEALGISEKAFRRIQHEIPSVRRGRLMLYRPATIDDWLHRNEASDNENMDEIADELSREISDPDSDSS